MAKKWKCLRRCFFKNRMWKPGQIYDGEDACRHFQMIGVGPLRLAVYPGAKPQQWAGACIESIAQAGHKVLFDTNTPIESIDNYDAPVIFDGHPKLIDIAADYQAAGKPVYILSVGAVDVLGSYPVAKIETNGTARPSQWSPIGLPLPTAYNGPMDGVILHLIPKLETTKERAPELTKPREAIHGLSAVFSPLAFRAAPRVVCIGGGPSLAGFNWDLLKSEVVVGANRAYENPNVGMMVTMDERFCRWAASGRLPADGEDSDQKESWGKYPGYKVLTRLEPNRAWSDVVFVRREDGFKPCPPMMDLFPGGRNSGLYALMTAWALGAEEIMLLGYDMGATTEDGPGWFHSGYPMDNAAGNFADFREDFNKIAPCLEHDGVRVVVYGPSSLDCFDKKTLAAGRKRLGRDSKPMMPVVSTMYTDAGYEAEVKAMTRTAVAFGLEVKPIKAPDLGTWGANIRQKPSIIHEALLAANGRPMAFVDADARFRAFPDLFHSWMKSDAELGLSWFDWDAVPGNKGSRKGRELSAAVMLFKPTPGVHKLLDDWEAQMLVAELTEFAEQRVLQDMIEGGYELPPCFEFPMSYNQIFDSMASLGNPVIEQTQASRSRRKGKVCLPAS